MKVINTAFIVVITSLLLYTAYPIITVSPLSPINSDYSYSQETIQSELMYYDDDPSISITPTESQTQQIVKDIEAKQKRLAKDKNK